MTQFGASSLNIVYNFGGANCQMITPNLEDRPSLTEKSVQQFSSLSTFWQEM
jgi:hypothetical protein